MNGIVRVLHLIYLIILMLFMLWCFVQDSVCGVCFAGFMLINARLNERENDERY